MGIIRMGWLVVAFAIWFGAGHCTVAAPGNPRFTVAHGTHVCVFVSQWGFVPEHWASVAHESQVPPARQTSPPPPQSGSVRHTQ